ncbi:MAG: glycerol acyltransferase, partial [Symploca sp. SIO2B6]|nr:glycerol acyltransferase [Symploca sp. SIO2B6]
LDNCYQQARQLHDWGLLPWMFDRDPEVFPIFFGWPWGLALGPLPNLPWPSPIRTRVCSPIVFERYGREAIRDNAYVDQCYNIVVEQMQMALNELVSR